MAVKLHIIQQSETLMIQVQNIDLKTRVNQTLETDFIKSKSYGSLLLESALSRELLPDKIIQCSSQKY